MRTYALRGNGTPIDVLSFDGTPRDMKSRSDEIAPLVDAHCCAGAAWAVTDHVLVIELASAIHVGGLR